ncbi:MAG: hypothetical protein LBC97_09445 [Bifidobacteriaceae bacterium]|jgi:hypothetical protein|nr:hypothetical protein [Bifidobacteriaceae bacterium]
MTSKGAADAVSFGQENLALFDAAGLNGFDAIITRDRRQLRDPNERAALRENSLHWVGCVQETFSGES